ncbi:hypothetical protein [Actinacidiphila acididurans]|uniref:Uncharacterized protein n=1 Tax=Actinacidiphila acididurans TaxID=2784346 RepID=A0ABS2TL54_9ACTN|nr:hypothetical protein [Actinacidiphila acididurans]MBM9503802.1 hypothetical protein [Actinacidiphila acididurans]
MFDRSSRPAGRARRTALGVAASIAIGACMVSVSGGPAVAAPAGKSPLIPGDLLVSRVHYTGTASMITPGVTVLPTGAVAVADGSFAHVWDNVSVDENFGVTAPIHLDQITPSGTTVDSITAPDGTPSAASRGHDLLMGSFSSKSELALNLSTGGDAVTLMGYVTPANTLDASNGNTPGVVDPTNPDAQSVYRAVGELDANGKFHVTETNAYSGDNGRAAILDDATGTYYTAGNSNNGSGTSVPGTIYGTGAQLVTPAHTPEQAQNPGQPTPVGGFSVTQLPGVTKADKLGKDTNFASVALHDGVLYYTKGSGSNGVDTVYFVDTTGTACPSGVGTPVPGAPLPTAADTYDAETGQPADNMCVLAGFPTAPAKSIKTPDTGASSNTADFGAIWFANPTTIYVGDSGNGTDTYSNGSFTAAAAQNLAGIQKWSLVNGTWTYDYTLNAGLGLGVPYTVPGLPTGTNPVTGTPWTPAVDGIRNFTGKVNSDGTVSLYGVTTAVGGVSDYGADPNKLVSITDNVAATSLPAGEKYTTLKTAAAGDVLRGVSFTPGSTR